VRVSVPAAAQACSVKVLYSTKAGSWADHGSYIEREDAQQAGGKGVSFGVVRRPDGTYLFEEELNARDHAKSWGKAGDEHMFKVFISPERQCDLRRLATEFVEVLSRDLKTNLEVVACDHYNTDQPHLHLMLRGVDDQGETLRLDRKYISEKARKRAAQLVTDQLGYRAPAPAVSSHDVRSVRMTFLDEKLLAAGEGGAVVDLCKRISGITLQEQLALLARMHRLEAWGLVRPLGQRRWSVHPDARTALEATTAVRDVGKVVLSGGKAPSDKKAEPLLVDAAELAAGGCLGRLLMRRKGQVLIEDEQGRVSFLADAPEVPAGLNAGATVELRMVQGRAALASVKLDDPAVLDRYLARCAGEPVVWAGGTFAAKAARAAHGRAQQLRHEAGQAPLPEYTPSRTRSR